jgi:hypothetical protein
MTAYSNTVKRSDRATVRGRDDLPWTCSSRNGSTALLEKFIGDMSKSSARLYSGNIGSRVQSDIEHAIKLNHQMTVLSTQAGTRVGVATTLCCDFDTIRTTTVHSGLDLWNSDRHGHCCRRVRKASVERFDVCSPIRAAGLVNRDGRLG